MPNRSHLPLAALLVASLPAFAPLHAQEASLVYLLGRDTVAIEQWQRTSTRLSGQMVYRGGARVQGVKYAITIGRDGRPTAATFSSRLADGQAPAGSPNEVRLAFGRDTVVREMIYTDSVVRRAFAVRAAMFPQTPFVYGPTELLASLRRGGAPTDSVPTVGMSGGIGFTGLDAIAGRPNESTFQLRGAAASMTLRFDDKDRLLEVDGSLTLNKAKAMRGAGGLDMDAITRAMTPVGTLSGRAVARATFDRGAIVLVDYGRPRVRERSVWGGSLIPLDSVWRAGANEATHLFTTRTLDFGGTTIPAGSYTLWLQHTATDTWLIVNRQIGQWGTDYDARQNIARVRMELAPTAEHVEEYTITVRAKGAAGRLELAWGDKVASAGFSVVPPRR